MIEHSIRSLISGVCKVYYVTAPQKVTTPYIVLTKISNIPGYTLTGESGLFQARIQISIFADTYKSAKETAEAVDAILSGYQGTSESAELTAFKENETDFYEDSLFQINIDYMISYNGG
jgi:hypothetical protein